MNSERRGFSEQDFKAAETSQKSTKKFTRRNFIKGVLATAAAGALLPDNKGLFYYEGGRRKFNYPKQTAEIISEIETELYNSHGIKINFGELPKQYQHEKKFTSGMEVPIEFHEQILKRIQNELNKYPPELLKGLGQTELFITEMSAHKTEKGETEFHGGWYGGVVKGQNILVLNFFPREKIEQDKNSFVLVEDSKRGYDFNHGINHEIFHLIQAYYEEELSKIWKERVEQDPRFSGYPTTRLEDVNTILDSKGMVIRLTTAVEGMEKETLPNMTEDAAEISAMMFEEPSLNSLTKDDLRAQKITAIKEFFFRISGGVMDEKYWGRLFGTVGKRD